MKFLAMMGLLVCGAFANPVATPESPEAVDTIFQAGEAMMLKVPLDTASVFNGAFPIDPDGYATLPILGRFFADNQTVHEVEQYIATNASQYLRDIHVTATPVIRLTLLGYWQHPAMVYVSPDASVWEACHLVGGPGGEENLKKWKVFRGTEPLAISLLDEYSRGTTLRNAGIRSGDIFVIPVPNPNRGFWYEFRETLTVIAQVAGITATVLTAYVTYLILDGQIHGTNF